MIEILIGAGIALIAAIAVGTFIIAVMPMSEFVDCPTRKHYVVQWISRIGWTLFLFYVLGSIATS